MNKKWSLNFELKRFIKKSLQKRWKKEKQSAARRLVGARYVRPFWSRTTNINERKEFGHWEIDLIVGKSKGTHCHLLSFTERVSRYGFLAKIPNKNPWNLNLYLWNLIWKHKLNVKSITQDNWLEFSTLFFIGYKLKIFIYKADPYASFQKGSNENFNGLVRRFFKKKTNFDDITEEEILKVQNEINNRPREIFGIYLLRKCTKNWMQKIIEIQQVLTKYYMENKRETEKVTRIEICFSKK